jgi:HK97 family phage prohead protease
MGQQQQTDIVCRADGLSIRSIDEQNRTIEVVASTAALDSYDEIVEQEWDLARYQRNPVVLWAHDSREFPIGTAEVSTSTGNLTAKIKFASKEANDDAEKAWLLAKEQVLRGVSVGFRSHDRRWEKRNDRDVYVLRKNELYEISMVPVPANPDGLAKDGEAAFTRQKSADFEAFKAGAASANKKDKHMDEKLLADLAAKAAELATKSADLEAKSAEVTRLTERNAQLERELKASETAQKALEERAQKAESKLAEIETKSVDADVASIIGKKITPDQKSEFTELRATWGSEKFSAFVKKMPDLDLTRSVIDADPETNTATRAAGKPSKLLAAATKAARTAGERS